MAKEKLMGFLKVLTIILILLFPLGELGRINIYNEISTTVNDILVFLLVSAWTVTLVYKKRFSEIAKRKLAKPIFLFVLIGFISLVFNINELNLTEFTASFLYLLRFVFYAGIYFVISGFDTEFKRKIPVFLVISGLVIVLAGFIQYFLYPNLRNLYYLGWDEHLYRLFSSFLDPNFAASMISLFLILILSVFFFYDRRLFLVFLSTFAFIALLLTYSRSGYLMSVVSISTLFIILGKKRYIAFLFIVFVLGLILLPKNFGGEGVNLLRTASITARSEHVENAITIFKEHLVLGVGFNAYRYAQYEYGFIDEEGLITSHAASGTDNSFLFVLATTGVVGLVFYLYMWFRIIKSCHPELVSGSNEMLKQVQHDTKEKKYQEIMVTAIIASSIGLFVNSFFINSLFYPFIMEWMWILIGLRENR